MTKKYIITIKFCIKCGWLMRAAWMAQEIINTYVNDIESVCLVPGEDGNFEIFCNDKAIFLRHDEGKFIEITEIKKRIRDMIDPERSLGHIDGKLKK
ncbi:MAG: SelT/SelW/SelH family protein [Proteobacteria bacterium]|nr:SelT/SelW/SelH family protein [Pseudomonadota bacterium]